MLNCETHLGAVLDQGQKLLATGKDAICFTLDDNAGILQFGMELDGYPAFYLVPTGEPSQTIWEDKTVNGKDQYLMVDQDGLVVFNQEDEIVWQAGGCLSPPLSLDAADHQLRLNEEGVRLLDPKTSKAVWSVNMEGDVVESCPEHELEKGGIAGVVVGSFFGFAFAVALLMFAYRRNLGRKQTSPAPQLERQESAEGREKKNKKDTLV